MIKKDGNSPEECLRRTAIALKGMGLSEEDFPKVVASGYGEWAEKIVKLAFDNGVKVREDKELAQILAAIELDSEIPTEALVAVAEVLSYVYKANASYAQRNQDDKKVDK